MHRPLLAQIKERRKARGWRQADMLMAIGMGRQQYQKIEAGGNPRLETLELIAAGFGCDLMLVPRHLADVVRQLESGELIYETREDPWKDLLADCDD